MNERAREVDKNRGGAGRVRAGAAVIFLLAAQMAVGVPGMSVDSSEGPPAGVSLPGMADTVIREDMGVDDLLAGVSAGADEDETPVAESAPPAVVVQPPAGADGAEHAALPILSDDALPPLMLERSTLQADLSVVPGITLNKIKTMSRASLSVDPSAPPASAPILAPTAPLAPPLLLPVVEKAVNPLPDPFPAASGESSARHIVDESRPVPAKSLARPAASSVTVIASRGGTHRVARGETLADVAALYYRDRNRWVDIYEANRDMIDKGSLEPGQVLAIP